MAISKRYLASLLVGTLAATPVWAADPIKIGVSQPVRLPHRETM